MVPPRKNRPVLFEVVARTQRSRRRGVGGPGSIPPGAANTVVPAREPPSSAGPAQREPTLRVADGRLRLVLAWPHLVILGILLLAVVAAAFQAGARSAQPPASGTGELEDLLAGPPPTAAQPAEVSPPTPTRGRGSTSVFTPLSENMPLGNDGRTSPPEAETPPESPEPAALVSGAYYVVVQHFPRRSREAAEAAREFLRSHGVDCVLHGGAGDWMLIVAQPFASEREAAKLVTRVRELGKEYFPTGRYDFKEAAARKF